MYKTHMRTAIFALLATLSLTWASAKANDSALEEGKIIYQQRCFQCHGMEGKGDGTAAVYLPRRPRDFTAGLFKLKTSMPDIMRARDEDIYNAISEGLLANGMPSWKNTLTAEEINSLVVYVKSFSDLYQGEPNPPAIQAPKSARTPQTERWGRKAYVDLKCIDCHGETGEGNPEKLLKDDYGMRIYPRDLTRPWTFIGPYNREALYARVTNGIPLTPMPPHYDPKMESTLSQQRLDAVDYIMSLAEEAAIKRARKNMLAAAAAVIMVSFLVYGWLRRRGRKVAE